MTTPSNTTELTNLAVESVITVDEIHFSQYQDPNTPDDDNSIADLDFNLIDHNHIHNNDHTSPTTTNTGDTNNDVNLSDNNTLKTLKIQENTGAGHNYATNAETPNYPIDENPPTTTLTRKNQNHNHHSTWKKFKIPYRLDTTLTTPTINPRHQLFNPNSSVKPNTNDTTTPNSDQPAIQNNEKTPGQR
jgi:hypothetical protein